MTALLELAALRNAIAHAYRDASLAGAKMRHVAAALEQFEAVAATAERPFDAWDTLDDLAVKSLAYPDLEALLALRRSFAVLVAEQEIERAHAAVASDALTGVRVYLVAVAEAITFWRPELLHALAQAPPPGERSAIVETIAARDVHVQRQRWPEVAPLVEELAASSLLPAKLRGPLYAMASRIALYHHPAGARRAQELLVQAIDQAPDLDDVMLARGELMLARDEIEGARALADRTLAGDAGNVTARLMLGDCLFKRGDLAAAEEHYREATRIHPGKADAYRNIIRLTGDPRSGLDPDTIGLLAARARTAQPCEAASLWVDAGEAFKGRDRTDDARSCFAQAIATDPERMDGYAAAGYLAHETGDDATAREHFDTLIKLAPAAVDGYWGHAFLAEEAKDAAAAEGWYRKGADAAPRWAGRCLAKAAHLVLDQGQTADAEAQMLAVVGGHRSDDFVLDAAERLAERLDPEPALAFVEQIRALVGERYRRRFHTATGDLLLAQGRAAEALAHYRASVALEPERASHYLDLTRALTALRDWEGSRTLLHAAPQAVREDRALRIAIAHMRNAEANECYTRGEYNAAIALYEEAIDLSPDDDVLHSNLAGAWERATQVFTSMRIDRAMSSLAAASELAPSNRDYRSRLRYLELAREFTGSYGAGVLERLPVVTPLALEVASDLVALVEGADGALAGEFGELVARMRAGIQRDYGVVVPGLRVRGNEADMPPGTYLIMLMEVPIVLGTVVTDRRLAIAPTERLEELGIDDGEYAVSPVDGAPAAWVGEGDWAAVQAAGIDLWSPSEVPVRHLRALLERNLADFVGHEETQALLQAGGGAAARAVAARTSETLSPLTAVLRGLLCEQVPIAELEAICARFLELHDAGVRAADIVEELRMLPALRERLPGNVGGATAFALAGDLAGLLTESIHEDGDLALLAMAPEDCQEALAAVRVAISDEPDAALVVDDVRLRALARKLFELEFPRLWVLGRRELRDGVEPGATIALEDGAP